MSQATEIYFHSIMWFHLSFASSYTSSTSSSKWIEGVGEVETKFDDMLDNSGGCQLIYLPHRSAYKLLQEFLSV